MLKYAQLAGQIKFSNRQQHRQQQEQQISRSYDRVRRTLEVKNLTRCKELKIDSNMVGRRTNNFSAANSTVFENVKSR